MSDTKVKKTNKVVKFFKDLVSETRKVVWPSTKQVINNTGVVLAVCALTGAVLFAVDALFGWLVGFLK
ncbi:MAG: preprotein translocase subunit SecE [Oscillospiraceae bacterium]|nr:preprotein translocase subunit SecE [Oscillospiraceae bacterium]